MKRYSLKPAAVRVTIEPDLMFDEIEVSIAREEQKILSTELCPGESVSWGPSPELTLSERAQVDALVAETWQRREELLGQFAGLKQALRSETEQ